LRLRHAKIGLETSGHQASRLQISKEILGENGSMQDVSDQISL